jgi:hypothetical protein
MEDGESICCPNEDWGWNMGMCVPPIGADDPYMEPPKCEPVGGFQLCDMPVGCCAEAFDGSACIGLPRYPVG